MTNEPLSSGEQGKLLIFTLLFAPSVFLLIGAIPAIFLGFGLFMMKKNEDFSSVETAVKYFKGYVWIALIGCVLSSLYWGISGFPCIDKSHYKDYKSCMAAPDRDMTGYSAFDAMQQASQDGIDKMKACKPLREIAKKAESDAWADSLAGKLNMTRDCPYDGTFNFIFFASMFLAAIAFAYLILVQVLFLNPLKSHREWVSVNGIFSSKPKSAMQPSTRAEMDIIKGEKLKQYSVADELLKWAKLKEDGHITEEEFNEARKKLLKRN